MAGTRAVAIAWPERGQMRLEDQVDQGARRHDESTPPGPQRVWQRGAGAGDVYSLERVLALDGNDQDGGPDGVAKAKEPVTRAILQAAVDRAFSPADIDNIGRIVMVVVVLLSALVLA